MKKNKQLYYDYLLTDEWKEIRHLVAKRQSYTCYYCYKVCRDKKFLSGFQVHHTTYDNIFNEREHLEDLQFLCEECHHKVAHKKKNKKKVEARIFPDYIIELINKSKTIRSKFSVLSNFLNNESIKKIVDTNFNLMLEQISQLPKIDLTKEKYKSKPEKLKYGLTTDGKLKFNCKYCHSNKFKIKRTPKNIAIYCNNPKCCKFNNFLKVEEVVYYKSVGVL